MNPSIETTPPNIDPHDTKMSSPKSSAPKSMAAVSVSKERKYELLLKARQARISWILDQSCSPFSVALSTSTTMDNGSSEINGYHCQQQQSEYQNIDGNQILHDFDFIKSYRACEILKSAASVGNVLFSNYCHNTTLNDGSNISNDFYLDNSEHQNIKEKIENCFSKEEISKATIPSLLHNVNGGEDMSKIYHTTLHKEYILPLKSLYQQLLHKLQQPECFEIIQGMKHFIQSFLEKVDVRKQNCIHTTSTNKSKNNTNNGSPINGSTTKPNASNSVQQSKNSEHDVNTINTITIPILVSSIHTYLSTLFETTASHPLWTSETCDKNESYKNKNNKIFASKKDEDEQLLEIFIYSKCYPSIISTINLEPLSSSSHSFSPTFEDEDHDSSSSSLHKISDCQMDEKLEILQFVHPSHLDLSCLNDIISADNRPEKMSKIKGNHGNDDGMSTNDTDSNNSKPWLHYLEKPILYLQFLDKLYSPNQILYCTLQIFKSVTEALSQVMNINTNNENKKMILPSADDILPTLILCIIHAKPKHIVSIMKFVEFFARSNQLLGEIGYAYTNLYSAVQFICELELTDASTATTVNFSFQTSSSLEKKSNYGEKPTLSISYEDLRSNLSKHRLETQARIEKIKINDMTQPETTDDNIKTKVDDISLNHNHGNDSLRIQKINIPLNEIREARRRGEDVFDWTKKWKEAKIAEIKSSLIPTSSHLVPFEAEDEHKAPLTTNTMHSELSLSPPRAQIYDMKLPDKYLCTKPEDIKLSDLPQLLSDYRTLFQTSESLLAEQRRVQIENLKQESHGGVKNGLVIDTAAVVNSQELDS